MFKYRKFNILQSLPRVTGVVACLVLISLVTASCASKKTTRDGSTELNNLDELHIAKEIEQAFAVQDYKKNIEQPPVAIVKPEVVRVVPKKRTKKRGSKKLPAAEIKPSAALGVGDSPLGARDPSFTIPLRRPGSGGDTVAVDPLWVDEKILMDVKWLKTKAGEFTLEVLPFKTINQRKVYHIKGTARTTEIFSLIYRAEDSVESFVDFDGWFPYKFTLVGDETKHIRKHLELFDHAARKQYVHVYDNRLHTKEVHESKDIKDLVPFSQDALSALYYLRNFDLKVGHEYKFPMTTNGNQWETVARVIKRDEIRWAHGYLPALKVKVETRFNGVMQQQGDAFVWYTDDVRHFPIRFEAKVRIGWVEGVVKAIIPGISPDAQAKAEKNGDHKQAPESLRAVPYLEDLSFETTTAAPKPVSGVQKRRYRVRTWFKQLLNSINTKMGGDETPEPEPAK